MALQITKISNPMQGMNFSDFRIKNHTLDFPGDFCNVSPNSDLLSPVSLTPPPTGRGKKGKSRSKKTIPKPAKPENQEAFSFHTPPESPEDCMDIQHHRGNSETPSMLSDADDDLEDGQDYRYIM